MLKFLMIITTDYVLSVIKLDMAQKQQDALNKKENFSPKGHDKEMT